MEDSSKQIIADSLSFLVKDKRVKVFGFVIMPNHIHLIWQVIGNHTPSDVQRDFLKYTSQRILQDLRNHNSVLYDLIVNRQDRKRQVWQRDALGIDLYTQHVFEQKIGLHSFESLS